MDEVPEIPGYKILSQIGKGGMAIVYLAIQESLDRKVALKVMEPYLAKDRQLCARFVKEGKFVARMSSHPDIVSIFDIGCSGNCYYMAMEYIPGGSLKERIVEAKELDSPLTVIRDISSALKHASASGIIHRDVKPGNILFRSDGAAVLTDFGIAKGEDSETQFTQVGFTVGSPAYMSLEQRIGAALDARSDLYSLGVVLYEMLTGEKPFSGKSNEAIAYAQNKDPVPRLPDALATYQDIINRLLARNPDDRYPDAQALIEAIDKFMTDNADTAAYEPAAGRAGRQQNTGGWQAKTIMRWSLGLAAGLVVSAGLGFAVWSYFHKPAVETESTEMVAAPETNVSNDNKPLTAKQKRVARLLEIAAAHAAMERYKEPPGSNAYEAYKLVLDVDPDNEYASRELQKIERMETDNRE